MIKHTVVKVKPRVRYLEVTVEVDYGGSLRWVALKVPWRMLNEQYRDVVEHMEHEALDRLRELQDDPQLRLPGID